MLKVINTYKIKMWYNDGYTPIEREINFLSGAEYLAEEYKRTKTTTNKFYTIYNTITVKFLGITIKTVNNIITEWSELDEL